MLLGLEIVAALSFYALFAVGFIKKPTDTYKSMDEF